MYTIYQKESLGLEIILSDIDSNNNKTPVNVSGYTVAFIAKRIDDNSENNDNAEITKEFILGDNNDTQNGIIVIPLTSQDTNIAFSTYDIQAELKIPSGNSFEYIVLLDDQLKIKNNKNKEQ